MPKHDNFSSNWHVNLDKNLDSLDNGSVYDQVLRSPTGTGFWDNFSSPLTGLTVAFCSTLLLLLVCLTVAHKSVKIWEEKSISSTKNRYVSI